MTISTHEIEKALAASKHYRRQIERAAQDIEKAVQAFDIAAEAAEEFAKEMRLGKAGVQDMGDQISMAIADQQKLFPEADETTMRIEEIAASIAPNGKGEESKP